MSGELDRPWWGFDPDERPVSLTERGVVVGYEAERADQAEHPAMIHQDTDLDERPVPLTEPEVTFAYQTERIDQAERQAKIPPDTDPTTKTLTAMREMSHPARASGRDFRKSPLRRSVAGPKIALLLAGCLVAFAMGWQHGASASTGSQHSQGSRQADHVAEITSGVGADRSTKGLTGNQEQRPHNEEVLTI